MSRSPWCLSFLCCPATPQRSGKNRNVQKFFSITVLILPQQLFWTSEFTVPIMSLYFTFLSYSCLQEVENESVPQPETAYTTEVPVIATTINSQPNGGSSEEGQYEDCRSIGRSPQSREAIAAAIQKLGVQLLQNLETTPEQPNVIISPFSISLALSQLALGKHVQLHLLKTLCT